VAQHGWPVAFTTRADGGWVIAGVHGCGFPRRPTDNQWAIYAFGPDGALRDSLDRRFIHNALPVYATGPRQSCTVIPWPFASGPMVAFDPAGGSYRALGDGFLIERVDGTLTRVVETIRYAAPRAPVTRADRQSFQDLLDEREWPGRELREAADRAADSAGYPDVWPALTELHVAGPGTVWARRGGPIGAEQEWDVLRGGRHIRTVVLPGGVRVLDVAGDRIAGMVTDELDVQYVAVFRH
jgi:hypothetical protein